MGVDFNALIGGVMDAVVPPAEAWGANPHRATGWAAAKMEPGIGDPSQLAEDAVAPDLARRTDQSRAEGHYLNMPVDRPWDPVSAESPDHVVAAIWWSQARMLDPRLTPEQRDEARQWYLHATGDVTQPEHVSDGPGPGDRGGNAIPVRLPTGQLTSLHGLWDTTLPAVAAGEDSVAAIAQMILRMDNAKRKEAALRSLDPQDWAKESFALAEQSRMLGPGQRIPGIPVPVGQPYVNVQAPLAAEQLYRATRRIAEVMARTKANPQWRLPHGRP